MCNLTGIEIPVIKIRPSDTSVIITITQKDILYIQTGTRQLAFTWANDVPIHQRMCGSSFSESAYWHSISGPWFNIKMTSYQYRKSHCGDKTILRPSYLHNGFSYAGKTTSLYWIGVLIPNYNCHIVISFSWLHFLCSVSNGFYARTHL